MAQLDKRVSDLMDGDAIEFGNKEWQTELRQCTKSTRPAHPRGVHSGPDADGKSGRHPPQHSGPVTSARGGARPAAHREARKAAETGLGKSESRHHQRVCPDVSADRPRRLCGPNGAAWYLRSQARGDSGELGGNGAPLTH